MYSNLFQMRKVIATFVIAATLSVKADKHAHAPTAGPAYSYYAPHPTTAAPAEAPSTTTSLPPPPLAPYDAYYDSLYHSPYQTYDAPSQQQEEPSYDSGGLYYYYYPTANEIVDDTTLVPETTTLVAASTVENDFQFSGLQKLFMILIGIGIAFPSTLALTSVKRRKRGKTKAKGYFGLLAGWLAHRRCWLLF